MDTGTKSFGDDHPEFVPKAPDIRTTRLILTSLGLPTELVLLILDHAHYWTQYTISRVKELYLMDWNGRWYYREHSFAAIYLHAAVCLRRTRDGEVPKVREVQFRILSHRHEDMGSPVASEFETSSWFEVSIVRGSPGDPPAMGLLFYDLEGARSHFGKRSESMTFVPKPDQKMEVQRMHCREMMKVVSWRGGGVEVPNEGTHAWYLQGNEVGAMAVSEDNIVENRVRWGCAANGIWEGNDGAGRGKGFVDSLQDEDCIVLWARVKVSYFWFSEMERPSTDFRASGQVGKIMYAQLAFPYGVQLARRVGNNCNPQKDLLRELW